MSDYALYVLIYMLGGGAALAFAFAFWPVARARHTARRRPFAAPVTAPVARADGADSLAAVIADDAWIDDNGENVGRDPHFEALFWALVVAHWDEKRLATPDDLADGPVQ
jgi:hypothetical protein